MSELPGILDYFFSPRRPVALVANLVILGITSYAILDMWHRGYKALNGEGRALDKLRERVAQITQPPVALGIQSESLNGQDATRFMLDDFALENRTNYPLVANRLLQLRKLREYGDNIDQSSLSALVVSELDDNAAFGRWSSTAVVLLGLTGTLVGLTQAVRASAVILGRGTNATIGEAVQAVTKTFDGVQVAFSATLMGAMSAVVLGVFLTQLRKAQGKFIRDLETFTTVELLPRYRTSAGLSLAQTARTLAELEEKLREALSGVLVELSRRGEQLVGTIEYRFDSLTSKYDDRSKSLLDSFERTQASVAKLIGDPDDSAMPLANILETLREASSQTKAAAESTAKLIPALEEGFARQIDRQTRDLYEAAKATAEDLEKSFTQQHAQVSEILGRVSSLAPALAEVIARGVDQQTRDISESLHAHHGLVIKSIGEQDKQLGAIEILLSDLNGAAENLKLANGETLPELVKATASLTELARLTTGIAEDTARSLAALPTAFASALSGRQPTSNGDLARQTSAGNWQTTKERPSTAPSSEVNITSAPAGPRSETVAVDYDRPSPARPTNLFKKWFG